MAWLAALAGGGALAAAALYYRPTPVMSRFVLGHLLLAAGLLLLGALLVGFSISANRRGWLAAAAMLIETARALRRRGRPAGSRCGMGGRALQRGLP